MQSLQQKASEWSGVAASDAFAIDETNLFETLGGIQPFIDLSTNFYNRVFDDEEEWFRSIFSNSKKEDAIRNQYEFFVQRMGGPDLYSQRKGHPALIGRHAPFPVTHQAAERWLHHMKQALDSTTSIDPDSKVKMMNFFRHTAYFLVGGNEMTKQRQQVQSSLAAEKDMDICTNVLKHSEGGQGKEGDDDDESEYMILGQSVQQAPQLSKIVNQLLSI